MRHRFQLSCTVEPDEECLTSDRNDDAVRRTVAEQLRKAIDHGTASEALSAAMHGTVVLGIDEESPRTQSLRAKARELVFDDAGNWHIDADAAVVRSERGFPADVYSVAGYVQAWVYTGIVGAPQEAS